MRFNVTRNDIGEITRAMHEALADGLEDITEDALTESNRVVPIEEGTLQRSGFAQVDRGGLVGQVAYDTPYAVVQHEDPTFRHDDGRRDHFLGDTVEGNRARYVSYLRDKVRRAVD